MTSSNTDAILATLHTQLDNTKGELKNYKYLYEAELRENRAAFQRINDLKVQYQAVQNEKHVIEHNLQTYRNQMQDLKIAKGYKKYHMLKSPAAKARRRAIFRRCLNQSIKNLHEIKSA